MAHRGINSLYNIAFVLQGAQFGGLRKALTSADASLGVQGVWAPNENRFEEPSNHPNVGNEITLAVKKLPVNIRQTDTSTRFNTRRPKKAHGKGQKATESLTEYYGTVIALIGLSGELEYPRRA